MAERFAASLNRLFSDEFLNTELFATVAEAQGLANNWRGEYMNRKPHSAAQGRKPLGGNSNSCCVTTHPHCAWTNAGRQVTLAAMQFV